MPPGAREAGDEGEAAAGPGSRGHRRSGLGAVGLAGLVGSVVAGPVGSVVKGLVGSVGGGAGGVCGEGAGGVCGEGAGGGSVVKGPVGSVVRLAGPVVEGPVGKVVVVDLGGGCWPRPGRGGLAAHRSRSQRPGCASGRREGSGGRAEGPGHRLVEDVGADLVAGGGDGLGLIPAMMSAGREPSTCMAASAAADTAATAPRQPACTQAKYARRPGSMQDDLARSPAVRIVEHHAGRRGDAAGVGVGDGVVQTERAAPPGRSRRRRGPGAPCTWRASTKSSRLAPKPTASRRWLSSTRPRSSPTLRLRFRVA